MDLLAIEAEDRIIKCEFFDNLEIKTELPDEYDDEFGYPHSTQSHVSIEDDTGLDLSGLSAGERVIPALVFPQLDNLNNTKLKRQRKQIKKYEAAETKPKRRRKKERKIILKKQPKIKTPFIEKGKKPPEETPVKTPEALPKGRSISVVPPRYSKSAKLPAIQKLEEKFSGELSSLECRECGENFRLDRDLRIHFFLSHCNESDFERWTKRYVCGECECEYSSHYMLVKHMANHRSDNAYKCRECDSSFKSVHNLAKHRKEHAATGDFPCTHCSKVFFKQYSLHRHYLQHIGKQKPFKCLECGEAFEKKLWFKKHNCLQDDGDDD